MIHLRPLDTRTLDCRDVTHMFGLQGQTNVHLYAFKLRSKADLLALCADAITSGNDGRFQGTAPAEEQQTYDDWQLPDEPDKEEAALAKEFGPERLAKADATLLEWVPRRFGKVARVLAAEKGRQPSSPNHSFASFSVRTWAGTRSKKPWRYLGSSTFLARHMSSSRA